MGFREFFGFNPSAIPEEHKAPTKAGNADDPTSRKSVEQFKTVNDVVDKGLSPEDQAIKNEEGVTEVLNEANQSDDRGLNAQESYEEEVLARRKAEEEEGWSPRKGVVANYEQYAETADEFSRTQPVERIDKKFKRKAGTLKMGGQDKAENPFAEVIRHREANKPVYKKPPEKRQTIRGSKAA